LLLSSSLQCHPPPRALHSFPTRRSSDLVSASATGWPQLCCQSAESRPSISFMKRLIRLGHWPSGSTSSRELLTTSGRRVRRCSRSEEHTSELQSLRHLVCRLLLEKKNKT